MEFTGLVDLPGSDLCASYGRPWPHGSGRYWGPGGEDPPPRTHRPSRTHSYFFKKKIKKRGFFLEKKERGETEGTADETLELGEKKEESCREQHVAILFTSPPGAMVRRPH